MAGIGRSLRDYKTFYEDNRLSVDTAPGDGYISLSIEIGSQDIYEHHTQFSLDVEQAERLIAGLQEAVKIARQEQD